MRLGQNSMLGRRRLYNLVALSLSLSGHASFMLGVVFSKLLRRAGGTLCRQPPPGFIYLGWMNVQLIN